MRPLAMRMPTAPRIWVNVSLLCAGIFLFAAYNHGELISCVWQSPRDEGREGDSPEVHRYMRERDSHFPFAVRCGAYVYHPAFLLLPGLSVLNQNRLPFLHRSDERKRCSISIH